MAATLQELTIKLKADADFTKAEANIEKFSKQVKDSLGKASDASEKYGKSRELVLQAEFRNNRMSNADWSAFLAKRLDALNTAGKQQTAEWRVTYTKLLAAQENAKKKILASDKALTAEKKRIGRQATKDAEAEAAIRERIARDQAQAAQQLGQSFAIAGAAMAAGLALAVNEFAGFEQTMINAKTVTSGAGDSFDELTELAKDMGRETQFSAQQAASAIEMLGRNSLTATQILDGALDASLSLAAATGADLSVAADVASDAMLQFGFSAGELKTQINGMTGVVSNSKFDINDYQLALAQAGGVAGKLAGVEFADFNTAIAAMSPLFASGSDAGTAFKTFLITLNGKSAEAKKELSGLGLEFFKSTGEMESMSNIAGQLNASFAGLTDQQRLNKAETIFGTDAMRAAAGLAAFTSAEFDQLSDKVNVQSDASAMAAERMATLQGSFKELQSALSGIAIEFGGTLAPAISGVAKLITELARFFSDLPKPMQQTAVWATTLAAGLAGLGGSAVLMSSQISGAIGAVKTLAPLFPTVAGNAAKAGGAIKAMGMASVSAGAAMGVFAAAAAGVALGTLIRQIDGVDEAVQGLMKSYIDLIAKFGGDDLISKVDLDTADFTAKQLDATAGLDSLKTGVSDLVGQINAGATGAQWKEILGDSAEAAQTINDLENISAKIAESGTEQHRAAKAAFEHGKTVTRETEEMWLMVAAADELGITLKGINDLRAGEIDFSQQITEMEMLKTEAESLAQIQGGGSVTGPSVEAGEVAAPGAPQAPSFDLGGFGQKQIEAQAKAGQASNQQLLTFYQKQLDIVSSGEGAKQEDILAVQSKIWATEKTINDDRTSSAKASETERVAGAKQAADDAFAVASTSAQQAFELEQISESELIQLKINALNDKSIALQNANVADASQSAAFNLQLVQLEKQKNAAVQTEINTAFNDATLATNQLLELGRISGEQAVMDKITALQNKRAAEVAAFGTTLADTRAFHVEIKKLTDQANTEQKKALDDSLQISIKTAELAIAKGEQKESFLINIKRDGIQQRLDLGNLEKAQELELRRELVEISKDYHEAQAGEALQFWDEQVAGLDETNNEKIDRMAEHLIDLEAMGHKETDIYKEIDARKQAIEDEEAARKQQIADNQAALFDQNRDLLSGKVAEDREMTYQATLEDATRRFDLGELTADQFNEISVRAHKKKSDGEKKARIDTNKFLQDNLKATEQYGPKELLVFETLGAGIVGAMNGGVEGMRDAVKKMAMQQINLAQSNLLESIVSQAASAIMSLGSTLSITLPLQAAGFAALQVAKGFVGKMAEGGTVDSRGIISGPGTPTSDSIMAGLIGDPSQTIMLSNTESILTGRATSSIGADGIDTINKKGGIDGILEIARNVLGDENITNQSSVSNTTGTNRISKFFNTDNDQQQETTNNDNQIKRFFSTGGAIQKRVSASNRISKYSRGGSIGSTRSTVRNYRDGGTVGGSVSSSSSVDSNDVANTNTTQGGGAVLNFAPVIQIDNISLDDSITPAELDVMLKDMINDRESEFFERASELLAGRARL